jgi:hypothetical protein
VADRLLRKYFKPTRAARVGLKCLDPQPHLQNVTGFANETMELVLETGRGTMVEECMQEAVKGMDPDSRLDAALQVIGDTLDSEERSQEVVVGVWRLILREKWWEARYNSLQDFLTQCGFLV